MRSLCVALALLAVVVFVAPGLAGEDQGKGTDYGKVKCICPSNTARTVAWCTACKVGMAFGQKVKSEKLVAALAGHEVKADALKCSGCKIAFKANGTCKQCKIGYRNDLAFHAPVSFTLANGELIDTGKIACPVCKTNVDKGKGFCSGCKLGVVAGLMFKDREEFTGASKAEETLAKAIKTAEKCEGCAIAMVSDGTCEQCKVSFKGGEKVAKAQSPKSSSGY